MKHTLFSPFRRISPPWRFSLPPPERTAAVKKHLPKVLCVAAGILLFFTADRLSPAATALVGGKALPRDSYGGSTEYYQISVTGLPESGGNSVRLEIPVSERIYREDELPAVYRECMDWLALTVPGENLSLAEIRGDIVLPTVWEGHGISIRWGSSDPELVSPFGTVRNAELTEDREVLLTAWLSDQSEGSEAREEVFVLPLTVQPVPLSPAEAEQTAFLSYLRSEDRSQQDRAYFSLPGQFEGHTLTYSQPDERNFLPLLFLGPLCAVLLHFRDRQNLKDREKARRRQLLLDYPEIVSKLMVFLGAGMTVRLAWESIVRDYEADREKSGRQRYAYEEMSQALSRLKTGSSEAQVYNAFGRHCGLRQYMKLAGILEQNRRAGMANLRILLGQEMQRAWEDRKMLARRQGEEAGTRLLGPLFLMLLIVMVIIITPAILSFL